jgi:SAM-dependent methyltransferase
LTSEDPDRCAEPTTYYTTQGPLGLVLELQRSLREPGLKIGVVGLGVGTVGAYCRPGDTITFAEIDTSVVAIAERYFKFLDVARRRCSRVRIITGDGRLVLRSDRLETLDVLVADAFSSDAIPAHLVTAEAISEYRRILRPSGAIAFHVSNRYYDLVPMLSSTAQQAGLTSIAVRDEGSRRRKASVWVVSSASSELLIGIKERLQRDPHAHLVERIVMPAGPVWTDDRHSLMSVLLPGARPHPRHRQAFETRAPGALQ